MATLDLTVIILLIAASASRIRLTELMIKGVDLIRDCPGFQPFGAFANIAAQFQICNF